MERFASGSRSWSSSVSGWRQRRRARRLGGPEGERLEAELRAKLQEIGHHIDDLRASLE